MKRWLILHQEGSFWEEMEQIQKNYRSYPQEAWLVRPGYEPISFKDIHSLEALFFAQEEEESLIESFTFHEEYFKEPFLWKEQKTKDYEKRKKASLVGNISLSIALFLSIFLIQERGFKTSKEGENFKVYLSARTFLESKNGTLSQILYDNYHQNINKSLDNFLILEKNRTLWKVDEITSLESLSFLVSYYDLKKLETSSAWSKLSVVAKEQASFLRPLFLIRSIKEKIEQNVDKKYILILFNKLSDSLKSNSENLKNLNPYILSLLSMIKIYHYEYLLKESHFPLDLLDTYTQSLFSSEFNITNNKCSIINHPLFLSYFLEKKELFTDHLTTSIFNECLILNHKTFNYIYIPPFFQESWFSNWQKNQSISLTLKQKHLFNALLNKNLTYEDDFSSCKDLPFSSSACEFIHWSLRKDSLLLYQIYKKRLHPHQESLKYVLTSVYETLGLKAFWKEPWKSLLEDTDKEFKEKINFLLLHEVP